jgi:lysophospholipase L1-like esterase
MKKTAGGRRSAVGKLILLCSSLLLTFLVLEAGSRIWLYFLATPAQYRRYTLVTDASSGQYRYTTHHYLNYYPTPGYQNGLTTHNSLGYRGPDFPEKKPEGAYRIAVLGGSTVYSVKIRDDSQTFTAQMERVLQERYGYRNVEVVNAGVGGYNSWESLINLQFRVLDLEPDLVVVYQGTNDVHARLVLPRAYKGDNSGRRRQWRAPPVPLWEWSCLLRILSRRMGLTTQVMVGSFVTPPTALVEPMGVEESLGLDPQEILEVNPPVFFRRNLRSMVAVAREHGVAVLLSTWAHSPDFDDYAATPHYQRGFGENNRVVREVAAELRVPLFDFASRMPRERKYWADGRHVNRKGALLKAELFAGFVHEAGLIKVPE